MLNSPIHISSPNNDFSTKSNDSQLESPHSSPPSPSSLSPTIIVTSLQHLLHQLKQAIQTHHSSTLPLFSFTQILQPSTFTYYLQVRQQFVLTTGSIDKFVRLLQIINICISNIKNNKCITKRNLYYKLQHYYHNNYQLLSHDLAFLRYNLYHHISSNISLRITNNNNLLIKTQSSEQNTNLNTNDYYDNDNILKPINNCDLNIVASSRCVIWGNVSLVCDGRKIAEIINIDNKNSGAQIIQVPTCKSLTIHTSCPYIIIIQKQSILYQLTPIFKSHSLQTQYLLITAKGYPDYTTRHILTQLLCNNPQTKVYYLGDYDVYGFDIYMCYAMGDWGVKGILQYADIVDVGKWRNNNSNNSKLFDIERIQREIGPFQKGDYAKILEIQKKLTEFSNSKLNFTYQIQKKIGYLTQYFAQFVQNGQKCELQLLHECAYNKLWVHQLIKIQNDK